ncbi:transporter substrate-binding domain-containing protein [Microbulbifer litoralis]|uniref:transporter substrate-binding domain-containing protein n=1 Tax=Microbulbifer litoralis TaxID=2933965 RepID=UPI0020286525|nr:transporter substrate-binding domain-containing protein [Microbulbifer sp. GX H0434]
MWFRTCNICLVIAIVLLAACHRQDSPKTETDTASRPSLRQQFQLDNYIEIGDLSALRKRGIIRFVSLSGPEENHLPRSEVVTQSHFDLANQFARRLKLEAKWVQADTPKEAIQMLLDGHADVLADNFTDTEKRRELFSFSIPVFHTQQHLVTGSDGPDISDPDKLENVEIVVNANTTHVDTARQLIDAHPDAGLTLREVPLNDRLDDLLDLVNEHPNTITILDSNVVEGLRSYRDDVHIGAAVSEQENIAWGVRKESRYLRARINNFLTGNLVQFHSERFADWDEIRESGVIRLLTYNHPTSYFLWKGLLMGFDYDLARAFAEKHDLQLQVVVVPHDQELIDWLMTGRGDIAGSSTTITQARIDRGVAFTTPYLEMREQVVSNSDSPKIEDVRDLAGRTLTLRAYSSFIKTAEAIRDSGIDVEIEVAPEEMSYSQIINMIADGELDATIVDAHAAKIESSLRDSLVPGLYTSDPRPQGWMVLPQNTELKKKLDRFLKKFRETEEYQRKYQAYFEPNKRFTQKVRARIIPGRDISPFDQLVRNSALEHQFDWRLVVAQMWQESNFNPDAVSPVGAQGLLQVMPATAEEMGYPPPLFDPERGIKAGVKYLDWVRDRFDPTLPTDNKLWFTLASYNAGYGHLLDAQRLAKELGLDPDIWFDNVEVAMLKLSEPRYFNKARYGYVRGAEPVQYVRNISELYKAYSEVISGDIDPPMREARNGSDRAPPAGGRTPVLLPIRTAH